MHICRNDLAMKHLWLKFYKNAPKTSYMRVGIEQQKDAESGLNGRGSGHASPDIYKLFHWKICLDKCFFSFYEF